MNTELIKEFAKKNGFNRWRIFKVDNKEYVSFGLVDNEGFALPIGLPTICYEYGRDLIEVDSDRAFELLNLSKDFR